MKQETLKVKILPKHFAAAPYGYCGDKCPLGQALMEMFPGGNVWVGAFSCGVGKDQFLIPIRKGSDVNGSLGILLWGGISCKWSMYNITKICDKAKVSLEGIPTKTLTLTKIH